MPELPEVETVRQILRKKVIGRKIKDIKVYWPNIIKSDMDYFINTIVNQTINEVDRIGKFLLFKLDTHYLISHLRMEGKYFLKTKDEERIKHEHVVITFTDEMELRYHDTRKFGTMHVYKIGEELLNKPLNNVGLEPFNEDFSIHYFKNKINNTKKAIKTTLLDQSIIAGLGNIYVDEVLYLSNLHPEFPTNLITDNDIENIIKSSKKVLTKAIELGGTTIRSYVNSEGATGRFQNELLVHSRKDEECYTCGATIKKIKVGGRGTYYCPKCQIMNVDKSSEIL